MARGFGRGDGNASPGKGFAVRSGTIALFLGVCALHTLDVLPGLWALLLLPAALQAAFVPRIAPAGWFTVGFLWALASAHATLAARVPDSLEGRDLELTGRITSIPVAAPNRIRFDFEVRSGAPSGLGTLALSWYRESDGGLPRLVAGETWRLVVRLRTPRGFRNPGGFDYETWLFQRGYSGRGYVRAPDPRIARLAAPRSFDPARTRQALLERIRELGHDGPGSALAEALVVGVRERLTARERETLRRTGTSHLLAISGLHIGLAAGLGFVVACFAGPWLLPSIAPLRLGAVAGIVVAAGYAALAGFSLPTRRALVMTAVLLGALSVRRRLPGSAAFCLGLAVVLLLEPAAVLAPGFWLSFCAVAMLGYAMRGRPRKPGSALHWRSWALPQLAVTVGLAPLVLLWFAEQPIIGPVANAVAIPFVGVAVVPALLSGALCLLLPGGVAHAAGEFLLGTGVHALGWLYALLELLAAHGPRYTLSVEPSIPSTALAMVGAAIVLAPPGLPGRWAGVLWFAPLLWWSPSVPEGGEVRATFLDVGHGLAVVVETRDRVLVYDTGGPHGAEILASHLAWRGRRGIDTLVLSHGDSDHAGGYPELARLMPITKVLANEGLPDADPCIAGVAWTWNAVGFEVVHPPSRRWQGNDGSCVVRISVGTQTLLLTGDIEVKAERRLLERSPPLRAEVLSAPHHGSKTSSHPDFLDMTQARHAVFSVRHGNAWNLPAPEVLARYRARGVEIHRTDRHGAVTALMRPDGAVVFHHWRRGRFWNLR